MAARYCGGCGRHLPSSLACPNCGSDHPAGRPHCDACGSSLSRPAGGSASQRAAGLPAATAPRHSQTAVARLAPPAAGTGVSSVDALAFVGLSLSFAVSVFVRFFRLGDIPAGLASAENAFREAALGILDQRWVGLWSESVGGHPAGLAYLLAGWVYLFGDDAASIRLVAAAAGVATVGLTYLFCRAFFGQRAAIFAALLLAFGMWHLAYSRLAQPGVIVPLVELAVAYPLLLALTERRDPARQRRLLVLSGALLGVGLYFSNGFIVFGAAVVVLWGRESLAGDTPLEAVLQRSLAFFLPALVVALPYVGFVAASASDVTERVRASAVSREPEYQALNGVTEQSRHVVGRIARSALDVVSGGGNGADVPGSAGRLLDPITGLLSGVGLLVAAWRVRRREFFYIWAVFGCTLIAVGLTGEDGRYERMLVAAPALFAAAGLGLDWLLTWTRGRLTIATEYGVVSAVVAFVAWSNLSALYRDPLSFFGP